MRFGLHPSSGHVQLFCDDSLDCRPDGRCGLTWNLLGNPCRQIAHGLKFPCFGRNLDSEFFLKPHDDINRVNPHTVMLPAPWIMRAILCRIHQFDTRRQSNSNAIHQGCRVPRKHAMRCSEVVSGDFILSREDVDNDEFSDVIRFNLLPDVARINRLATESDIFWGRRRDHVITPARGGFLISISQSSARAQMRLAANPGSARTRQRVQRHRPNLDRLETCPTPPPAAPAWPDPREPL